MAWLPYIFTLLSFVAGFYMSSLSFFNKIDNLIAQMSGLSNAVERLSNKLEISNERYNSLDKRVSILEIKSEAKAQTVNVSNEQNK